jgi:hypothetical protein
MTRHSSVALGTLLAIAGWTATAHAQSLGTFRWQLQPYCNVVSVVVTQSGGVYRLEGTDDQCGAGNDQASVIGTAFQNPTGTIGIGLNIVTSPGGLVLPVQAEITMPTLSGTWRDSAGNSGTFSFTPGAGTGGGPRPGPPPASSEIPASFALNLDGSFLARGTLGVGNVPASGTGTRMMWHAGKAAFRAGHVTVPAWDDGNIGDRSAAFGFNTTASGRFSVALGTETTASGIASIATGGNTHATGDYSTAFGSGSSASGPNSTAMGFGRAIGQGSIAVGGTASGSNSAAIGSDTNAIGSTSIALGNRTRASGRASFAMGDEAIALGIASAAFGSSTEASGHYSVAMGLRAAAVGQGSIVLGSNAVALAAATGTFIFGDRSTEGTADAPFTGFAPNEFLVRAAGGVGFYTNRALTTGLRLAPSGSQWLGVSDVNTKEHFRDVSDDQLLRKIAAMPIREWSYKAQDPSIRHIGPTAQDFHAAFGLGEDPLRIGTMDADGVALAGVKALENRTRAWAKERAALVAEIERLQAMAPAMEKLKADNAALAARVIAIEQALARLAALP